jgi:hypothetical protein
MVPRRFARIVATIPANAERSTAVEPIVRHPNE